MGWYERRRYQQGLSGQKPGWIQLDEKGRAAQEAGFRDYQRNQNLAEQFQESIERQEDNRRGHSDSYYYPPEPLGLGGRVFLVSLGSLFGWFAYAYVGWFADSEVQVMPNIPQLPGDFYARVVGSVVIVLGLLAVAFYCFQGAFGKRWGAVLAGVGLLGVSLNSLQILSHTPAMAAAQPGINGPSQSSALETGVVATCSEVRGWKDYVPKNEFHPGEAVCVYAEALNVNRDGRVDISFRLSIRDVKGAAIAEKKDRYSAVNSNPHIFHWDRMPLPVIVLPGTYTVTLVMRNNLTGRTGHGATKFVVLPNDP